MNGDERQPTVLCQVEDLREGWQVDLEGDPYGDDGTDALIEYEFVTVEGPPVRETADCIAVPFSSAVVGFPPGHRVPVRVCEVEA